VQRVRYLDVWKQQSPVEFWCGNLSDIKMRQIRGNKSTVCAMKREVRTGCDGGLRNNERCLVARCNNSVLVLGSFCARWLVVFVCLFVFISKHSNTFSSTSLRLYLANICIPHDDSGAHSLLFTGLFFSSFVF